MSIITARGHESETIKHGIEILVKDGYLPKIPNYLGIYPVSNPNMRKKLGDSDLQASIAELKRSAIRQSVEMALQKYGYSPHHRFGMSDDDEHNIELITEEMRALKKKYPKISFFVIQTYKNGFKKREILIRRKRNKISFAEHQQLNLF